MEDPGELARQPFGALAPGKSHTKSGQDGVEKRLQKNSLLTLNDGADSANWGSKADIGFCMWRDFKGPTFLHIDKVKDHETMGRPNLCEMIHDPVFNRFSVGRIGYEHFQF